MDFVYFSLVILIFWSVVVSRAGAGARARSASFRVIGGRDARPGSLPYVVRVEARLQVTAAADGAVVSRRHVHVCTAAALARAWTLSAAHCCFPPHAVALPPRRTMRLERRMVLRLGAALEDDDGFSDVLECVKPPSGRSFYHPAMVDDVVLLRTQQLPLREYARLSALDYRAAFGRRVTVLGFGNTNHSGVIADTLTLRRPLQVVDAMWSRCDLESLYPYVCAVEACARHAAVCPGDSGGPVLHASGVVGVNSRATVGNNCQMKTDATRYSFIVYIVPVSTYVDWIADTIALM